MDIERVKSARDAFAASLRVLEQAEKEARELEEAANAFRWVIVCRSPPEELQQRWEVLVKAAERVLGREEGGDR
jgi:hypothetical protein